MFSVANAVLLRALPYHYPEELALVWTRLQATNVERSLVSGPDLQGLPGPDHEVRGLRRGGGRPRHADRRRPGRAHHERLHDVEPVRAARRSATPRAEQDGIPSRHEGRQPMVAFGGVVNGVGIPPAAATRRSPCPRSSTDEKTIVSSEPQDAATPRAGASHSVTGGPPRIDIFFNLPPAENPTHSPSGEKNGNVAPSEPRIG